ncbi:MAG: translation initiation factor IF-2 N-terminal domain-containing protein, partial [Proteobacteria bacterium]|nr:translation initiation factor IF-2 N-terminal domain-containing protein [Pseudomonadota bacterium]
MGKIRVYELAKQLDMANKDLVEKLNEMGYTVKSHSSTIDEYIANEVRDRLSGKKSEVVTERRVRPTVIRRRKKIVEVSPTDEEADQAEAAALEEESLEGKEEPLEPVSDAQVDAGTEVEEAPKVERIVKIKKTARGEEPARIVSLPDTRPQPEPEVEAEPVTRARVEVVAKPETAPGPGVEAESGEEKAKDDFAAEAARLHDIVPESQGELQVEGEVEGEMEVAAEQTELEAADTVEAAEGVEPETGPKPGPTRHKEPVKIKRIKKVTDEPARIISRPKVVLPPPRPEPAPPSRTAPPPPAPPRKGPAIKQVTEVQPPATEGRKGKKRKKAKESDGQGVEFGVRKGQRRKEIIEQAELYDSTGRERPSRGRKGSRGVKKSKKTEVTVPKAIKRRVKVVDAVTVADLAKKMGIKASDVIRKLLAMGLVAHINQAIDYDSAALVAAEFGYEVEKGAFDEQEFLEFVQRDDAERRSRPPVVTVMGHVDHGKT